MKTQEFYWAAQRRNWQPGPNPVTWEPWAHGRVLPYTHKMPNLSASAFKCWNWYIKFDQSALCYSERTFHFFHSEKIKMMRWWEFFGCLCCAFSLRYQHIQRQILNDDLATELEILSWEPAVREEENNLSSKVKLREHNSQRTRSTWTFTVSGF